MLELQSQSPEWRPGATVESPAIVLSSLRYQETGKIVHLLTPDQGRITVYAPGAVNSRKRFGASLEPMCFIQAQLRLARDHGTGHSMTSILKADLRDSFLHLRTHSALLESGAFAVKFINEFLPEGQSEPVVFRAVGRFLRDSVKLSDPGRQALWARFAFWNWMSRHFGFGDLKEAWGSHRTGELSSFMLGAWNQLMEQTEPDFGRFFDVLVREKPPHLTRTDEGSLYGKWTEISGFHWPDFERWLQCSSF